MNPNFGTNQPLMPPDTRALVVGTTADYIHWIRCACPGEALFLTDQAVRRNAAEPPPLPSEEVCCDLTDYASAQSALAHYLRRYGLTLEGVTCFDCESMELAAVLAQHLALPYVSVHTVHNCRDKLRAKRLWRQHRLITPDAVAVRCVDDAVGFFEQAGGPVVLKPVRGSGSELVFKCDDAPTCARSFDLICQGLDRRHGHRMYASPLLPESGIMAEKVAAGEEFSCDFTIDKGRVALIRLAQKIKTPGRPFGTATGYLLPTRLPEQVDPTIFALTLKQSATALGIDRAVCMLDFMIHQGRISLLELAPRPGGDCLPFLIKHGFGVDMLKLLLDFCRRKPPPPGIPLDGKPLVGLRVHARKGGILQRVDTRSLERDARVQEISLTRGRGHCITLPPADYESWLLGHIVFAPDASADVAVQCNNLLDKIGVEVA
ncbi:MAG: ATP-grasp domain-containing protein [Desulfobacteraceae bacterium]|jgi:hypothetical protein